MKDEGMIFTPDLSAKLEVYVDADFAKNWDPVEAVTDCDTAWSCHGYIMKYLGCPVIWKLQLQAEIALSSTESEYTVLSYAQRLAIPLIGLLKEMRHHGFEIATTEAAVHCHIFEDNSRALEMSRVHKFRPRTKHLNVKLHHFRSYVEAGEISIHPIASAHRLADYVTKPLAEEPFTTRHA